MLQSLFYLTIAIHVSGIIVTHFQEHNTNVTTASGNRYTVLLSVTIVEELELMSVRHLQHTHISSNSSTIATDNNMV
jgi:hypothetical protein